MKFSIISISFNDGPLLERCIRSIYNQKLPEDCSLEHIVVDGGSTDESIEALDLARSLGSRVISLPAKGVYNAINSGISAANGDVIGLVHGTDMLADDNAIARVATCFNEHKPDFIYGDVNFIEAAAPEVILRSYSSEDFTPSMLRKGIAPPHPSLFITAAAMAAAGPYKEDYRIGADFELFVRLFLGRVPFTSRYLPGVIVTMEKGGMSGKLFNILFVNTIEKRRALRENGINASLPKILMRYLLHFRKPAMR